MDCPICGTDIGESSYPNQVCDDCDERAVGEDGKPAKHGFEYLDREPDNDGGIKMEPDTGTNPVFIHGEKCWRRYRFGGWVTMLDDHDYDTLKEFYEAHGMM